MIVDLTTANTLYAIDVTNARTLLIQCRPASGDPSAAVVEAKRAFSGMPNSPSVSFPGTTTLDLSGESITTIDVTDTAWVHIVCTTAASGITVDIGTRTEGRVEGRTLQTRIGTDYTTLADAVSAVGAYKAFVIASPSAPVTTGVVEIKQSLDAGFTPVSFAPAATLTLDGATVRSMDTNTAGVLQAPCTTAQTGLEVDLYWYLREEVETDMTAKNFIIETAAGRVDGYSSERKFGRNVNIGTATTPEDVWNGGGVYTGFPTTGAAETVEVFSASGNDTSAGTGARTVQLFGLDADYNEQTETITMNGTTPVTSSLTYWRLARARVLTVGSGQTNAGEITIRHTTTTANVFAVMPAAKGQTAILAFTVPAGKKALFSQIQMVVEGGSNSGAEMSFEFKIRDNSSAGVVRTLLYGFASRGAPFVEQSAFTDPIGEKVDVWVTVTDVSSNGTIVSGDLQYMLVPA